MIDNARISILGGGFFQCTPDWNRDRKFDRIDSVFSLYLPVSGGAVVEYAEEKFPLSAGNLYFISSHHLVRQACEKEMGVYWVNFVSESYYMHHRLMAIRAVHAWPVDTVSWVRPVFQRMAEFYLPPEKELNYGPVREDLPEGLAIQLEAVVMQMVGALVERTQNEFSWDRFVGLDRLKPAINYMDENYLRNPPMSEIAKQINLTTAYFHRAFKRETGLTPFKYMENRRLDFARKLLFEWRLNVTEVAGEAGYDNLSYFTRIFHRRFGFPPSDLRRGPRATGD